MNKEVVEWITKITQTYAKCNCGRRCHISLTIAEHGVKFFVYCPNCDRKYSMYVSTLVITECGTDLTDKFIDKVKKAFSREAEE